MQTNRHTCVSTHSLRLKLTITHSLTHTHTRTRTHTHTHTHTTHTHTHHNICSKQHGLHLSFYSCMVTLAESLENELDRLESAGIIEKVEHLDWAAPVVPYQKVMENYACVGTMR